MTRPKPTVAVTRRLPDAVEARLSDLFDARVRPDDAPLDEDGLIAFAAGADVLAPTLGDTVSARVIEALPSVKLIANFGAGTDHIDLHAAQARGVPVTNTPSVLNDDTADMTMALMLAVSRRLVEGVRAVEADAFAGWSPTWMLGRRLGGRRLGVVGMGRIGQAVARRARAFDLDVHYHNRHPVSPAIEAALGATHWPDLEAMLPEVDIVTLHIPKTPETHHLLNAERLAMMRPHAIVVNAGRGDAIDEAALADALEAGRLGGAALDVFERGPAVEPRLKGLPNVVLTPHLGSATLEARIAMGERVLINIRVWQDGERPPDRVLPDDLVEELL